LVPELFKGKGQLDAMTRLRALSERLVATTDLSASLGEVLDTAIALHAADFGTIESCGGRHCMRRSPPT
jgi:hypothetical protein